MGGPSELVGVVIGSSFDRRNWWESDFPHRGICSLSLSGEDCVKFVQEDSLSRLKGAVEGKIVCFRSCGRSVMFHRL